MKTSHTPGPWIEKELPHGAIYIEAHPDTNNGHNIAKCFGPDREANARLIAAAPELLAILEKVLTITVKAGEYMPPDANADALLHEAYAILTKATQP